uniref:A to I editase domain-containing protein n=1 Tax=Heliothis virescens TaxID=7102 RepID=A0A2A4JLF7_HELVI
MPEVINATTGKLESGQPSLLCKQSMFARWHYLVKRLPLLPQETEGELAPPAMPDNPDTLLYNEAKQMCPAYQLAKQRLIEAFEKAKLGRWIKRPLEQDQFVCEVAAAAPALLDDRDHCDGRELDKLTELRLPLTMTRPAAGPRESKYSGYERLYGNDKKVDVANDGNHGNVGVRSLSYYKYRYNKVSEDNVSHSDRFTLPNTIRTSAGDNVYYDNISSFNDKRNDHDGALGDDEWDDDDGENSRYSDDNDNVRHMTKVNDDADVTLLTHKINDVSLGDDKTKFWREFYKSRQARRACADTKDCDVTERTPNYSYNEEAQFDDNSISSSVDRDRFKTKDATLELRDPLGDKMKYDHNNVVNSLRRPRNMSDDPVRDADKENTVSNVNRRDKLTSKLAAYYASKFRDEPEMSRGLWRGGHTDVPTEDHTIDYFFNNDDKVSKEPSVKNSLLLRRLQIYEQINSKKK